MENYLCPWKELEKMDVIMLYLISKIVGKDSKVAKTVKITAYLRVL